MNKLLKKALLPAKITTKVNSDPEVYSEKLFNYISKIL